MLFFSMSHLHCSRQPSRLCPLLSEDVLLLLNAKAQPPVLGKPWKGPPAVGAPAGRGLRDGTGSLASGEGVHLAGRPEVQAFGEPTPGGLDVR